MHELRNSQPAPHGACYRRVITCGGAGYRAPRTTAFDTRPTIGREDERGMTKHQLVKIGVTATAIAAAGVLIAPSAVAAAPHYRIHAGSHASGTANYVGKTVGKPGVTFKD